MNRFVMFCMFVFAVVFTSSSSRADDFGYHGVFDARVRLVDTLSARFTPEFVLTEKSNGVQQTYVRLGPSWQALSWLNLGVNGYLSQMAGQDVYVEPQVELTPRVGSFVLNDRNRLGYRPLDSAVGDRWNYQNELRLSWDSKECAWSPFVADELFVSSKREVYQNRAMVGLGHKWDRNRLDVAYMLRYDDAVVQWLPSHFLFMSLSTN